MTAKPNHPWLLNTVAHGQMNSSSMSKMMKKIAIVENLIAKRPSGSAIGSLPHSNGSILTAEWRRGAISSGMPMSAPPTSAETAKTMRIGMYSTSALRGDGWNLAFGVVGGADERAGLDVGEAEGAAGLAKLREFLRRIVAGHRQVLGGRPQVLPERQDVDVDGAKVAHRLHQLWVLFSEPQDDARLCQQPRRHPPRAAEELERALVAAAVARHLVEARHRLRVVVEDVGRGVDHGFERGRAALEVGDEQLDAAAGRREPDRAHRRGECARAAVGQVIAVHRRDDDVLEPELADGVPNALRLLAVLPHGLAVRNGAVSAVPRADVAQDHEGRGRLFPALADVRAVRLLADRMEIPLSHQPLQADVVWPARRADFQPSRLWQPRRILRGRGPGRFDERKRKSHGGLSFFPVDPGSLWHTFHKRNSPSGTR